MIGAEKRFNHGAPKVNIEWQSIGALVTRNTLGSTRGGGLLELEFDIASDDLVAFNLNAIRKSAPLLRQMRNARLASALAAPAIVFVIIGIAFGDTVGGAVTAVATGVLLWFLSPYLSRRQADRNVRKMAAGTGLGRTGRHHLSLSDEGLREVTPSTSLAVAWSVISRIDETADHAFIYFSPVQAFIIPKRIGADEVGRFLAAIRARLDTDRVPT